MKVGVHASESLSSIVARKQNEEREAGFFLWGYGGSLCHPLSQAGPLAAIANEAGAPLFLLMIVTSSKHRGTASLAAEYSSDRMKWTPLPSAVRVLGSKYAFVCKGLHAVDRELDLASYAVAVGAKKGLPMTDYLRGRVDKGCAVLADSQGGQSPVKAAYAAELVPPYAVFVR